MTITVIGTPGPQGSKKPFRNQHTGRIQMTESSAKVKPWREAVVWAARESGVQIFGPVVVEMIFTLPKPKSAPKTRKTWPDKKPDASKLARSTEDALVTAGIIEDDARIVRLVVEKVFPLEHADALDVPGCVIRIEPAQTAIPFGGGA